MMPVLFPIGNYYFIGPSYFNDPSKFLVGTVLVFGLYWLSVSTLTLTIWWAIRRYPAAHQTIRRSLVMLVSVLGLTIGLAIFDVWVYSLVPVTGVRFSWASVRPIWLLGAIFDVFLCVALGLFYTYARWKQDMTESEQLQRVALQHQYDTLKEQLNPHFLFNALNSLSVLISEEPQQAERFVDKLAVVYRYMLQADRRNGQPVARTATELVTLQAELNFIQAYTDLLAVRYGQSLQIQLPSLVNSSYIAYTLPTLSVQTLVDNAIKFNAMSATHPLWIVITITDTGWLQVTNNRQARSVRLETGGAGLGSLAAKYRLLTEKAIRVDADEAQFLVELPLLTPNLV
ncbi:MAG: sensor histidine kinase [Spirosoma sp.]|nr:sensor histidine kinase [Spirosoma sp.]MBN8823569.1 sensor histidine kinase [Spirosoma sp.]OJW71827.1 MAG: histidine kinase [Spirosoma sp. 48-14]